MRTLILLCGLLGLTVVACADDPEPAAEVVEPLTVVEITLERYFSGGYGAGRFNERFTIKFFDSLEYEGSGELPEDGLVRKQSRGHSRDGQYCVSPPGAALVMELEFLHSFVLDHLDVLRMYPWADEFGEHSITNSVSIRLSSGETISRSFQAHIEGVRSTPWALVRLLQYIDKVTPWEPC